VQGASPALLRHHPLLEARLAADPATADERPRAWLDDIRRGLGLQDPAQRLFFVRELVNWNPLHAQLGAGDVDALAALLDDPLATPAMLQALYEPRPVLQARIGMDRLAARAGAILSAAFVDIDADGPDAALLRTLLEHVRAHDVVLPDAVLARWSRCSQPRIAEQALLVLAAQDHEAAVSAVDMALAGALPNPATRRALEQVRRRLQRQTATTDDY
jgi:hypothetical protein